MILCVCYISVSSGGVLAELAFQMSLSYSFCNMYRGSVPFRLGVYGNVFQVIHTCSPFHDFKIKCWFVFEIWRYHRSPIYLIGR